MIIEASVLIKCTRIIKQALAEGPKPEKEVAALCMEAGLGRGTYECARKRLGVKTERRGFGRGAYYVLWLPDQWEVHKEQTGTGTT